MTVESNNYMILIAMLCDWPKDLSNKQDAKQKPIILQSVWMISPHALSKLQVITRNCNWFIAWFAPAVIGHSN